jgi:signal transduction histidine kinase
VTTLFDEVRRLELFEGLGDEPLSRMLSASEEMTFSGGDLLWTEGEAAESWWVLLEGRIQLTRHLRLEQTVVGSFDTPGRWAGGFVAWDRSGVYLATARAAGPGRILRVPAGALRELLDGVPLVRHFIEGLFTTARTIEASVRSHDALVTLGTLSAGLAHELNNPAAAATRAVDALEAALGYITAALRALAAHGITAEAYATLDALRQEAVPQPVVADAVALALREEALSDWMVDHGVQRDWLFAPTLASASFETEWCDRVLAAVGQEALQSAIQWVTATVGAVALLGEVRDSTRRISTLVSAVKSYSHLDRAAQQRIDVVEGIESTLTVLGHKLRVGDIVVERDYADDLPMLEAYAGELNQVWTNLIDNALDAMDGKGVLRITTRGASGGVVVEVADTGPGMPPEVVEQAFEPFFTTKEVGRGTGLGLDIARRIVVERHGGTIEIDSEPGHTVLRVLLPFHGSAEDVPPAATPGIPSN